MAFFGGTSTAPAFGSTATTSAAPTFGGFGTTATTSSGGLFGSAFGAKTTAPTLGFGTAATTTASGFGGFGGFGTTPSTGFGTGLGTTSSTGFGLGTSTLGTSTAGFGAGGGLGTSSLGTTGIGGSTFGTLGTTSTFGANPQQQQQQQQQQAAQNLTNMGTALSMPMIFGDERDAIIAKWNQLQAFWGTGKGYFSQNGVVDFSPDNPFCRFKALGYSRMPSSRNEDGFVGLIFDRKKEDVQKNQQQMVEMLHRILGSKPTLSVCVEGVKSLPDNKCEAVIYVLERSATGATRRISSSELFTFLSQPNIKNQLLQQLTVAHFLSKTAMMPDQLKQYLDNPPAGIDALLWQQAKLDNPDPEKLIPVPMIGFNELYKRLKHQEQQTNLHQARMDIITADIADLQRKHSNMMSRTEQYKRKHLELGHRVLQVMVKQEIYRKLGYTIQADEEQLRVQLEALQAELNAPTQFKGRLNELMSQIRMQNQLVSARAEANYQVEGALQTEIRQHLKQQQEGLQHLISILKEDMDDLKTIEQGLAGDTAR